MTRDPHQPALEPPAAPPRLRAVRFFVLLVVLNVVALWPWPGVAAAYSRVFATASNTVLGWMTFDAAATRDDGTPLRGLFGSTGMATFVSDYASNPRRDLYLAVINAARPPRNLAAAHNTQTSSWYLGYVPTAMTLAWILATPLPWSRRLAAAALGLVGIHLFIALRVGLTLLIMFNGNAQHCLYAMPDWLRWFIGLLHHILAISLPSSWLAPVVIWMIICLRRRTLADWFGLRVDPDTTPAHDPGT